MKDQSKKQLFYFFVLSFAISWGLWSPLYFSEEISEFWLLPGAWGPTLAALILTARNAGKEGVKRLLKKLLIWKVPFKYYLFAILGMLCIGLLSIAIHILLGGNVPDTKPILEGMGLAEGDAMLALVLAPLFFLINTLLGGPIAEELGWRGFAQPLFQHHYGPIIAGLSIGLLWSLWHIPLMIFVPKAVGHIPIMVYIPMITAMGLIFSWLYNHTRESVLLAILLHGGVNFAIGFLGASILKDQMLLGIFAFMVIMLAFVLGRSMKGTVDDGRRTGNL